MVYKEMGIDGLWKCDHPMARGFGFRSEEEAQLVEAMAWAVNSNDELMRAIKPVFRILGIRSKWSE